MMAGLAHSSGPLGQAVQGEEASQEKAPTVYQRLSVAVIGVKCLSNCKKKENTGTIVGSLGWSSSMKHPEQLLEIWSGHP